MTVKFLVVCGFLGFGFWRGRLESEWVLGAGRNLEVENQVEWEFEQVEDFGGVRLG